MGLDGRFPLTEAARARNSDPDAVFVVAGASRGIGAELCAQLLDRTAGTVVACCREPLRVTDARLVGQKRLRLVQLDVSNAASIASLDERIGCESVDVLINNVGILHDQSHRPERSLADVGGDWLVQSFQVNAVGALLATKALERRLRACTRPSVVVNISARVGSISDNHLGGWYAYRMSKAALNMATRTMAVELKRRGVVVVSLHPGTTDTDLSAPFQKNVDPRKLFDRSFTANQLLTIADGLELTHTGRFFAWDGEEIPY